MMTPDLQMTRQQFFARSKAAAMEYGLSQAVALLREIDNRIPGYQPATLSMVDEKLTVTIWEGARLYPFSLTEEDFFRNAADIAEDIVRIKRTVEHSQ